MVLGRGGVVGIVEEEADRRQRVVRHLEAWLVGVPGAGFGRGYLLFANRQPVVPDLQTDFIFTAIATLGAFIHNVSASLVGGLGLTLTDD